MTYSENVGITRALSGRASPYPAGFELSISVGHFIFKSTLACTQLMRYVVIIRLR